MTKFPCRYSNNAQTDLGRFDFIIDDVKRKRLTVRFGTVDQELSLVF